jgi:hypothetical protein
MGDIIFWVLIGFGVLLGLMGLMFVAGLFVARTHTVARALKLKQSPEAVWQVISDFSGQPGWHALVVKVARLDDKDGHEVWRETYQGNYPLKLETLESQPPRRLVRSIQDEKGPFQGRWEYDITPLEAGSQLTITEHGDIANPFFRFMARMFLDPAKYLEMYLKALAAKFGEPAAVEAFTVK